MKITCITHGRDPIFQGCLEGTLPGSYSENSVMSSVQRAAIAWNILNAAGIPGVTNVYVHPITNGVNVCVQIQKRYQGQPRQIAAEGRKYPKFVVHMGLEGLCDEFAHRAFRQQV